MSARPHHLPRRIEPELEIELSRNPSLGSETSNEAGIGVIRCLQHGFPTPLARWHYHDEYELHLIIATTGKAFVGDWIDDFRPGHLVLTGPRLPHNWISMDVPDGGIAERDLAIQFPHEPIARVADKVPEFAQVLPMLERARHGVEFFGFGTQAHDRWREVKAARGAHRFAAFCGFLADLAASTDYRLLSSVQMKGVDDERSLARIDAVVSRITDTVSHSVSAADIAAELGMTESRFSRFFRRATGNTFTDFVNRVRVNRACHLLLESDSRITDICYVVGFNNVANFNRRFLDIKGMTPREYRRQGESRFGTPH
jgi:AraC-like DNA-binding protein